MTDDSLTATWAERAADRSPLVQRSRTRSVEQAKQIVGAARRLIAANDGDFTTQELVKEAGVALQTFYRHFGGKDQLLLAVLEDLLIESCAQYEHEARDLADPVARLRHYITTVMRSLCERADGGARFITAQHWRLHQVFPDELALAIRPFRDLVLRELRAAQEAGTLRPSNPEYDAWFVNELVVAVYHHYTYATPGESVEVLSDRLWSFCLAALGGSSAPTDDLRTDSKGARSDG